MTEKRFRIVYHDEYDYELDYITDNAKQMHIEDIFTETDKPILDVLNEIAEENEELKNENAKMKKELSSLAEFNQKAIL